MLSLIFYTFLSRNTKLNAPILKTDSLIVNFARTDLPRLCWHGVTRSGQSVLPLIPTLALYVWLGFLETLHDQ